ncbi:MAG: transposase [Planctomycetes bacterium]|nr:transposase [Planctomycetota bacterium]
MGANLPHWTAEGATYSVTFRLADSIPASAVERLQAELADLKARIERGGEVVLSEQIKLARLQSEAVDDLLNSGQGECLMNQPAIAAIVAGALKHFDGQRYRLIAWCVMPNHVHVVFAPMGVHGLSEILHTWKSFTANQINKQLGRSGTVWQSESYDHLIRDRADLMHHVFYARENQVKAGLNNWPWTG